MTREDRGAAIVTLIAVLLAGMAFLYQCDPLNGGMSVGTRAVSDSLDRTAPAHDSAIARLEAFDSAATRTDSQLLVANARLAAQARASQARADRERDRADSIAAAAQTAEDWKQAHDVRFAETLELRTTVDSLHAQVDTLTVARDNMKAARDSARLEAQLERDRRLAHETLNARLKADLAKAIDCKIVWRIRCPSRTKAGIVSAGLGFVAARR